jgi:pilus assembly protein CpaE
MTDPSRPRLMLAGMSEASARQLRAAVHDLTDDAGYLQDWTYLEAACKQARPDIVAIYLGGRPGQVLGLVRRARAMSPDCAFLAVADDAPATLVEQLAESGVADLVLLPELPSDMRRAVRTLLTREKPATLDGEVIAVLGAKGGVGTTSVAVNLAAELAARHRERRVILVDLHVYLGDAAVVLDLTPKPSVLWFIHRGAVADARTWVDAPPTHAAGFQLLGLDADMTGADPISAEQVVFLLERLKASYHYVVVDCGSEVGEVSLSACTSARQRLLVTTEDIAARSGARRRADVLKALEIAHPLARLVVNRVLQDDEARRRELENTLGMPVLACITNAWKELQAALEAGQTLRQSAPRAQVARDYAHLADVVGGTSTDDERRKRTFFTFFR